MNAMYKSTTTIRLVACFLALVYFVLATRVDGATTSHDRPLKCVYFIPSDCEPYPDRAERLFRVMTCVQDFYRNEMERNGFGPMTFGLEFEKPGELKLYEVRAPQKQAFYGRESYYEVRKVVAEALAKQGIDVDREVVVIFQLGLRWEGNKAIEVSSFVGGGTAFSGTAWFYDDPMLDPENLSSKEPGGYYMRPCSIGQFNTHYIGGIAHELGHALTLPHDCELSAEYQQFGHALMGAGNHTFGNEIRGEGKGAFLSYSEALRLSVVPAISGKEPQYRPIDVKLVDLKGTRVSKSAVCFSGKIETEIPTLGLIFYEDLDSRDSDYDAKSWTVKPDENGFFQIELTEVAPEPSELRICAVRDIDTVQIGCFSYNPDGSKHEFEPIERAFQNQKINAAFLERDADALSALTQTEFLQHEELKQLCEDLSRFITERTSLVVPSAVDLDVSEFDLSDASFSSDKVGWGFLSRRSELDGSLLLLNAKGYSSGLCAHAPSILRCDLGKKWQTFQFCCGLQDGFKGSVVFIVRGDGQELFRCVVTAGRSCQASINVSDVQTLELITEDAGDGRNGDHSIWFEPVLTR